MSNKGKSPLDTSWPPLPTPTGSSSSALPSPTVSSVSTLAPTARPFAPLGIPSLLSSPMSSLTSPLPSQSTVPVTPSSIQPPPSQPPPIPRAALSSLYPNLFPPGWDTFSSTTASVTTAPTSTTIVSTVSDSPGPYTHLLYSPTVGFSSSSDSLPADTDSTLRELRSSMACCMDRSRVQEQQIISLFRQHEDLVSRLTSLVTQQSMELQALRTSDTNKDTLIRTLSEEIIRLRTSTDTRFEQVLSEAPGTEIQEKIATIQTEVQRHSEWVDVVRRAPVPPSTTVSETLAESDRRAQRSLNLRIRGIETSDTASPLQQAIEFTTQTMGVTDHGVISAYRAGTDPSRPQPLIVRFRDAEARLAVLRRRIRLRDHHQIHMDEDLTPLQWQEYRALLPQRHTARQQGLWAVIRDGRLITRPLRTAQPGSATGG